MKVFISMPMKGKTDEQIKTERKAIEEEILLIHPDAEFIDKNMMKSIRACYT